MRRGLSAAIASDLASSRDVYAQSVDSFNGAYGVQASQVLEGYFIENNGRLSVHASVLDLESRKAVRNIDVAGPAAGGAIALVNQVAKQISPAARQFETQNGEAFRSYGEALSAGDRASALREMEAASKEDPRFSLAYLDWAKLLLSGGDRAGALNVLETAKRQQLDAIDRAQLDYLAGLAQGDNRARENALETLTRLTPADAKIFGDLADLQLAERKYPEAIQNYEAVNRLEGEQAQIWNDIGYARAFAGDLKGAKDALDRYQAMMPRENVNPLDSLGEVSFYTGDFAGAEKYFVEADQRDRAQFAGMDLFKAAQARLFAGDLSGADGLFEKYLSFIQSRDPGRAVYLRAQWDFVTGRRRAAMAGLEKLGASLEGDGRSLALSQLSVWKLETGDAKSAEALAEQAESAAVSPAARNLSALCRIISKPDAGPSGSRLVDGYALLFARKYAQAVPLLEILYRESDPRSDGQIRTLLAWAYVETNRTADAGRLVAPYPIPFSSGETLFTSLIFPRYWFVRGAVLQEQGKRAEAKAAYELFLKYAGDVPGIFGDEATARKSLTTL
jgi:predicted negative regulator of RcsB-dependent stress response